MSVFSRTGEASWLWLVAVSVPTLPKDCRCCALFLRTLQWNEVKRYLGELGVSSLLSGRYRLLSFLPPTPTSRKELNGEIMDKTWSYNVQIAPGIVAKFVIEQKGTGYNLLFDDGNATLLHSCENMAEIRSYLLTMKSVKTENASYLLDETTIPPDLSAWTVHP